MRRGRRLLLFAKSNGGAGAGSSGPAARVVSIGEVAARVLLAPPAMLYGFAVGARNFCYDAGLLRAHRVPAPVIGVGNITTGGVGKTPLVAEVAARIGMRGLRPAIVARGYGRRWGETLNDEGLLLAELLPDVIQVQHPDRVAAARRAVGALGADAVVLDDGFGHRRLFRDADLLAVDATAPFGGGRLLPAGRLREPLASLARAQALIITRTEQVPSEETAAIERILSDLHPGCPVILARTAARSLVCLASGTEEPVEALRGATVVAFCGIGNPENFFHLLETLGAEVVERRAFRDHAVYSAEVIDDLVYRAARRGDAVRVICTGKDAVKLRRLPGFAPRPGRVAQLRISAEICRGSDLLDTVIDAALARGAAQGR
ncbi:MAG: tetraacyldisaccharide 4'-kinase [Planctomycetes bacterium]|nr:tetraacyldisaccharide 4'-kinase [Planctomycetota bacterium]